MFQQCINKGLIYYFFFGKRIKVLRATEEKSSLGRDWKCWFDLIRWWYSAFNSFWWICVKWVPTTSRKKSKLYYYRLCYMPGFHRKYRTLPNCFNAEKLLPKFFRCKCGSRELLHTFFHCTTCRLSLLFRYMVCKWCHRMFQCCWC